MGSSHSYLQNLELAGVDLAKIDLNNVKVMHLDDWCYANDSAEALKICTPMQMSGGKMKIKMDHLPHTMMADTTTVVPSVNLTTVPVQLQELNGFTNWVHNAEHKVSTEFHKINWKDVGIDAWHGIEACYQNEACRAAVEKYGEKAVEDAAKLAGKFALMELNGFTNWFHTEENKVKADFHKVNWKDLGIDAWHGVEACYQNEKCRAAVVKYGLKAVEDAGEDAVEVAALMNLQESGIKKFFTGGDNQAIKGFFQGKDDAKIDAEIKKLALGAWHGVEHCMATPKCRAAVEKYGLLAVKIAVGVALAPVGALQNMPSCPNGDCMWLQNMPSCPNGDCMFMI